MYQAGIGGYGYLGGPTPSTVRPSWEGAIPTSPDDPNWEAFKRYEEQVRRYEASQYDLRLAEQKADDAKFHKNLEVAGRIGVLVAIVCGAVTAWLALRE
jgi:hypothetical protein